MLSLEYLKSKLVNYLEVAILIYKREKGTANQRGTYLLIIRKESWEFFRIPTRKVLKSYTPSIIISSNLLFSEESYIPSMILSSNLPFSDLTSKTALRFLETRCFLEELVLTSNQEMSFLLKRILIRDLTSKAIKDTQVFCSTQETFLEFYLP